MLLIDCEVNLLLTWSSARVITNSIGTGRLTITDTKLYVPVVIFSTNDNAKLLEQLKSGFKRTINWTKYQSKISTEAQNQYLGFLINPSFNGVNRLFVLSFENKNERTSLIDKLQIFVNLLLTIYQLILNYQKLNYLRWYNQENF